MTSECLSLRSCLAIRNPNALCLMLRGYYDGSGKTAGKIKGEDSEVLTLTGVVASVKVWERFDPQWDEVLQRHGAPLLHMADAMALQDPFLPEDGWTAEKVDALLSDLWSLIGNFRFDLPHSNLMAASCSVLMRDYRRAERELKIKGIRLREPEAICVNCCLRLPHDIDSPNEQPQQIIMVFDRGECFQKTIQRNWDKYKNKRSAGWPKQVANIINIDSLLLEVGTSNIPGMQVADLLAWTVSNRHKNPRRTPLCDISSIICIEHLVKTYNYDEIIKRYSIDG